MRRAQGCCATRPEGSQAGAVPEPEAEGLAGGPCFNAPGTTEMPAAEGRGGRRPALSSAVQGRQEGAGRRSVKVRALVCTERRT